MSGILATDLVRSYGAVRALDGLSLEVAGGEMFVLLGPSGCGKSTLLRCIAGLDAPDSGTIDLAGRTVFDASAGVFDTPREREVGMVFQNYALYPHMTVEQNIAFGLKLRRVSRAEVSRRVAEAIQLVDLSGLESRRPRELSGGQQQRVAIARSLVTRPRFLLFDEPLSNLDPMLRVEIRDSIVKILKELHMTALYVTHDQGEAMVMADRIAVMNKGRIEQTGSAQDIYRRPVTTSIAEFTAQPKTNLLAGDLRRVDGEFLFLPDADPYGIIVVESDMGAYLDRGVVLHVRPEDVRVDENPSDQVGHFAVDAVLSEIGRANVYVSVGKEQLLVYTDSRRGPARRSRVGLRFVRGTVYNPVTGRLMGSFSAGAEVA